MKKVICLLVFLLVCVLLKAQPYPTQTFYKNLVVKGQMDVEDTFKIPVLVLGDDTATDLSTHYAQSKIVAKSGAEYTTIQSAIDAITDATPTKRYAVIVYPGDYMENITLKDYVDVIGSGITNSRIVSSSGTALTFPATKSTIMDMGIVVDYGTLTANSSAIVSNCADAIMLNCKVTITKSGGNYIMRGFYITGGHFRMSVCWIDYSITGGTTGSQLIQSVIVKTGLATNVIHNNNEIRVSGDDTNDDYVIFETSTGGTGSYHLKGNILDINVSAGSTGTAFWLYGSDVLEALIAYNQITVNSPNSYGLWIQSAAGTAVVNTRHNDFVLTGAGANYSAYIEAGDEWNSAFDCITADEGYTGGGDVKFVSSLLSGNLIVTDTIDANVIIVDNLIVTGAETVNRTIYVATTGNDDTGDGSVGSPYLTIGKALSTIKKNINQGIVITISIGTGIFDLTLNDITKLIQLQQASYVRILGTLTLVESGFSMGAVDPQDAFTHNVSGGNTGTWTTNQWRYYFLKSGSLYYPITNNTTTTLSIAGTVTGTEIYEAQTTLNVVSSVTMTILTEIEINFENLKIVLPAYSLNFHSIRRITFINCYFSGTSAISFMRNNCQWSLQYCSFNGLTVNLETPANAVYKNCYHNKNTNGFIVKLQSVMNMYLGFTDCVYENPNTGANACCISFTQSNFNSVVVASLKFINSNIAIKYAGGANVRQYNNNLILNTVNYLFLKQSGISDNEAISLIYKYANIYGTPVIRWFYDNMYEFVNPVTGRNIQISGLIYPEIEQNLSATLTNNATTNVIVGNKLQNKSITIEYTLTRGTGYRKGRFDIINDGTTLYMSPDNFITNGDAGVSGSAVIFTVNYNTNEIRVAGALDASGSDATLQYSCERVMITPITF
jgi:hypothetical protein